MYRGAPGQARPGHRGDMSRAHTKTQQERKAETRERLLVAAAQLFAEFGVDAVSVDAVAEAAGRTSGSVYAHFGSKQGLLLALLDSWKDSVVTVLLAEVAVTRSPQGQLAAVWGNVTHSPGDESGRWALLEHELWLRAARDPEVAERIRMRNADARRFSSHQLRHWTVAAGAQPSVPPDELAVLVKALLTGLAMQRLLEPDVVTDDLAVRGLSALVGLTSGLPSHQDTPRPADPGPAHRSDRSTTINEGATP